MLRVVSLYVDRMGNAADTIQLLRTFVRITEAGSLSAAARTLGTSQASASRQLAALEDRIGASLIYRSTHDMSLTDEGVRLLAGSQTLLDDWEALCASLRREDRAPEGLVRIVAPMGLGPVAVAPAAARFTKTNPKVEVDLVLTDGPIDLVAIGADMMLRVGPVEGADLRIRRIGTARRWLVAAPDVAGALSLNRSGLPVGDVPLVSLAPFYRQQIVLLSATGRKVELSGTIRTRTQDLSAAYAAIKAGGGVGLLPSWLVADDVKAGRLVRIAPRFEPSKLAIHLAFPPTRFRPLRTRLFAEAIEDAVAGI